MLFVRPDRYWITPDCFAEEVRVIAWREMVARAATEDARLMKARAAAMDLGEEGGGGQG